MLAARPMVAALLLVATSYTAYPYVTLYRLGHAIHAGDAKTLKTLVDWPAVREGIKEDICDSVADNPETTTGNGQLPEFGASFVRGIAASAVDQQVTPEGLVKVTHQSGTAAAPRGAVVHVSWAFFDSPTEFAVSLKAPGQAEPIKLQMSLQHNQWQVTRVWLPLDLLDEANSRT